MKKLIPLFVCAFAALSAHASVYVGTSVGFLMDTEEGFYTARAGMPIITDGDVVHSLEAEIGYFNQDDSGVDAEVIPAFLNYRITDSASDKGSFYIGAGAGVAAVDAKKLGVSDDSDTFAAQIFAGLQYKLVSSLSLTGGLRYLWMDSVQLYGSKAELGDDLVLEVGLHYGF